MVEAIAKGKTLAMVYPAAEAAAAYGVKKIFEKKNHGTTDYGAGITSRHGDLQVGGRPYTELGYEATADAYRHMANWRDDRGLTTKNSRAEAEKLKARMDTLYPQYQMEQYMAAMGEYMGAMTEAMNRTEPAQEPLKQAQVEMSSARADTNRKQLLRRGLMSTYTRYGSQGGTQRLGA